MQGMSALMASVVARVVMGLVCVGLLGAQGCDGKASMSGERRGVAGLESLHALHAPAPPVAASVAPASPAPAPAAAAPVAPAAPAATKPAPAKNVNGLTVELPKVAPAADAFSNKLAVAMAAEGSEFVNGHGAGGLGFQGTGTGGGGEGSYGRIHGVGKVDTGGGVGVTQGLGRKGHKRVGKLKVGSGATQGFCDKGNVRSVVRRRAGAIRACYESRLQVKSNLRGKLTARWTISTSGSTSGVSIISNTLGDAQVGSCVSRVLRRMRFSKPEGGICVVQWPFVFNSGG